jgi:hypothetical protein
MVALLVWLGRIADAARHPPPRPGPLDFPLVMERFSRVQSGASRAEVERLLGPPTEEYAWGPEIQQFEVSWWNWGRNIFPDDREWDRWSDPTDPERWAAVVYTGLGQQQKVYHTLKKGF